MCITNGSSHSYRQVASSTSTGKTTYKYIYIYIHQLQSRVLRGRFPYQTTFFVFPVCCLQNVWLFSPAKHALWNLCLWILHSLDSWQLDLFSSRIQKVKKKYRKVTKYRFRGCQGLRLEKTLWDEICWFLGVNFLGHLQRQQNRGRWGPCFRISCRKLRHPN